MNLGQDMGRLGLQAGELGHRQDVVGLAPALLARVVDQHGVGLVPARAGGGVRVGGPDARVVPEAGEPLVHLDAGVVVVAREAEAVAGPDDDAARALVGREELGDHVVYVLGPRGRPYRQVERVEAVLEEAPGVGALDEVRRAPGRGPVEEGAVEVEDDEDAARLGEQRGRREGLRQVVRGGGGDAARREGGRLSRFGGFGVVF